MDKEALMYVSGMIITIALVLFGAYFVSKNQCLSSYENYQPQFGIFSGCRVMWNGVLTPTDIVREMK